MNSYLVWALVNLHRSQLQTTYEQARLETPVGCGLTRASHNHQSPRQTLQSPQSPPHWTMSGGAHVSAVLGCQIPFGHCSDGPVQGGQGHASYQRSLAPGSPVPLCLSSPQSAPPPILLSPSELTSHPGFPIIERCACPGSLFGRVWVFTKNTSLHLFYSILC